jgi:hypothetical protein
LCPNFSLTTGTFNLIVKDRIAFRLSGAPSVQANPHECEFDCPRNLVKLSSCCSPVNSLCPQDFHLFCTARSSTLQASNRLSDLKGHDFSRAGQAKIRSALAAGSSVYATERFFRSQGPMQNRQQAAAEEDSFKKRSLGGSCDNAKTLRGTLSPNAGLVERPIPGIEPVHYLMPDERQEIRIKRPASHTTLDGLSFIPRVRRRRKGLFTKLIPGNPGLPTSSGRAI